MRKALTVILIGGSLAISGSAAFAIQPGDQINNTRERQQYQAPAPSAGPSLPAVTGSASVVFTKSVGILGHEPELNK